MSNALPISGKVYNYGSGNALSIPAFDEEANVYFSDTVNKVANAYVIPLQFQQGDARSTANPSSAYGFLDTALCAPNPHPVIVGVRMNSAGKPTHYVLVTAKLATTDANSPGGTYSQYRIEDPAAGGATYPCPSSGCTLDNDPYINKSPQTSTLTDFEIRGYVTDPAGDLSALNVSVGATADILMTDPNGMTTGADSNTGTIVRNMNGASYWRDGENNEDTGVDDSGTLHSILVTQPTSGIYSITVTGLSVGPYKLSIRPYSTDGTAQEPVAIRGIAGTGSTTAVQIQYSSGPGTNSVASVVATFSSTVADINNSLQLGLIDNRGIANSLTAKINAASDAVSHGNEASVLGTLGAFESEVSALSGTHIFGYAPQVLQSDASSLASQY